MTSILIVGGGIVGLATAYQIQAAYPNRKVTLLEKESRSGAHQSTHNSGVLHCGLYYKPGSLKARLAVEGIREMIAFCRANDVPHEICGKLVVATGDAEAARLDTLLARGQANGLSGLRKLDRAGLRSIEPHAAGVAAAHVPEEGIVDYRAVCDALEKRIQKDGAAIRFGFNVAALQRVSGEWIARSDNGQEARGAILVNCAGLRCDQVAEMAEGERELRIVPFRGEYYQLAHGGETLVRHLIYPVPDPAFPFLGVHFTRMIGGGVEAGPNAVLAFSREGYTYRDFNVAELADALGYAGFWRFMARYPTMALREFSQSLSKRLFCDNLRKLVPELQERHLAPGGSGVRAQAMKPDGELEQDFLIQRGESALHLLNAPSPAATASLAIGRHLATLLDR